MHDTLARISGGDVQRELVNASKIAAARELYDGTGIDLSDKLERFVPLELWKEKKESVESDYPCELKKRVYFVLKVDDADFITQVRCCNCYFDSFIKLFLTFLCTGHWF